MTRAECELKLIELTKQAMDILHEYDPDSDTLNLDNHQGMIHVYAHRKGFDIEGADYNDVKETYTLCATLFRDGDVWDTEKWDELRRRG